MVTSLIQPVTTLLQLLSNATPGDKLAHFHEVVTGHPWAGKCSPAPHTLTLFKNIKAFDPSCFKDVRAQKLPTHRFF